MHLKKLFIVINVDWFFLSHRIPVALAALQQGYDVTIISKDTGRKDEIESTGLKFIDFPFERSGSNPLHELKCVYALAKLYRDGKPDIIYHITIKAALLGSLAAKLTGCRNVVNAITGLGYNFTNERHGFKQIIIDSMMKMAFKSKSFHYILENPDDVGLFRDMQFSLKENIHLIKGSGVDLNHFSFVPEIKKEKVRFVLPARMLRDKGVVEFINAAKKIKERVFSRAEFILAGDCDTLNLAGISKEELKRMIDEPYIQWIGFQKDMFRVLKESDVVVLPSYREGLPKSLNEACAVGRPIITTDTQGCRECVIDGYNGFLVPVKDTDLLAQKMELLINDAEPRAIMGKNSRILAEKEFSVENVIEKHLKIYQNLMEQNL